MPLLAVLGTDPGKSGCTALRCGEHTDYVRHMHGYDKVRSKIIQWKCEFKIVKARLEKVHAWDTDAEYLSSMWKFAHGTGFIEGMLFHAGIPIDYVDRWQYEFNVGGRQRRGPCPHSEPDDYKSCRDCEYTAKQQAYQRACQKLFGRLKVTRDMSAGILIAEHNHRETFGELSHGKKNPDNLRPGAGLLHVRERTTKGRRTATEFDGF